MYTLHSQTDSICTIRNEMLNFPHDEWHAGIGHLVNAASESDRL